MATYHCSVKIVSRSSGRSIVGAAAYRAGEKIKNERDGITHDYTRKGGVVHSEILLPENAPHAYSERALLWNEIEKSETRINSRTAREIEVALPRELNPSEQAEMMREYIKENFVSRGMIADFAIHNPDKGNNNPHAHILLTTRNITPEGFTSKNRDWNQKENVEVWRESWARLYNQEMQKKSLPYRVDHRSYERQGIDREPTIHRGPAAHHMEKRGIETDRGNINRGIEARNQRYTNKISELREDVNAYTADGVSLFPYGREVLSVYGIEIPDAPQGAEILTYAEPRDQTPAQPQREPISRAKEWAAPERAQGATYPQKEQEGIRPEASGKPRLHGDMVAARGPVLPLYVQAVREVRKCEQIDNPRRMEKALETIKRENIKSYGEFERRIEGCRTEIAELSRKIEPLTEECKRLEETIGPLKIYEKYLPYKQEIEKAGIFQKKKLERKYKRELQPLEGAKERLQRMGTDPQTVTLEKQLERLEVAQETRQGLCNKRDSAAQKWTDIEKSQKMMQQLFLDRGIDHERRSRELYRALDRGPER